MCDECHQSPHATMCPNNPALAGDHPIMKKCPICEREFDEEEMDYEVCDECLEEAGTRENALDYGDARREKIEINGLLASVLTPSQISVALLHYLRDMERVNPRKVPELICKFMFEDRGDFADWLVEQKKGGG